jgi:sugar lactone lactonase YvrE
MYRRAIVLMTTLLTVAGCSKQETVAVDTATTEITATVATKPPEPQALTEGFNTPESVLYDADQDVYFISNINGSPVEDDDNGYISRVNAETLQVESKWIDGAKPDVKLSGPKGMAIIGDDLYVADITNVRKFDRKTGKPKGSIAIPGSTFLNDMAADGTTAYVSDSGLKAAATGFAPTGTDAIWKLVADKPTKYASGKDLNRPNGIAVAGGTVWVVTFGADELLAIDQGKKGTVTHLPKGSLDGLAVMSDGTVLVSSWDAKAVYRGKPGDTFKAVIENVDSPADIGFDSKRNRLLVPHFMENRVSLHPMQ